MDVTNNTNNQTVANFYDGFATKQIKTGVNVRHRTIMHRLKKAGLKRDSKVLEIGCGIGTLTGLIGAYCSSGSLLAADISPESIEVARNRTKSQSNIQYVVTDMSDFEVNTKFDFVVLPDVLEHIPVEYHKALFGTIRKHLHQNSTVAIHIPDPYCLEWYRANQPEKLQIIDQPLYSNVLMENIYANDLFVESLERYSLHIQEGDYQWIILRPRQTFKEIHYKSTWQLKWLELVSRLFY